MLKKLQPGKYEVEQRKPDQNAYAVGHAADPEADAAGHGDQNGGNLVRRALGGAEADQGEGSAEGDAGADVAADKGDHRPHAEGDQGRDQKEPVGQVDPEAQDPGVQDAGGQGDPGHDEKLLRGDRCGINRIKHFSHPFYVTAMSCSV